MFQVTDTGETDTVDVTGPADADADTPPKPDDSDNHTGKFTISRPDGGSVWIATPGSAADANACRASTKGSTGGTGGPAGGPAVGAAGTNWDWPIWPLQETRYH
jgi:hypothetical protein